MLISLNKIKEYVKIDLPTADLIKLIGSRLVEVEGRTDLAPKYQGIKIVKVVSCEPIPDTHLHLCQVDAGVKQKQGGAAADAVSSCPPDGHFSSPGHSGSADLRSSDDRFNPCAHANAETGLTQVVCGAPNVHSGMLAAWIMPGAVVPSTYGGEDFRLSVRKLRGYESHGMLAAADELDLGTDHEGIIEIDPKMTITGPLGATRPVTPGDDFAVAFDLNDIILDIENKSLTHRPDCFGLIGFAREVAGILGQKFEEPVSDDTLASVTSAAPGTVKSNAKPSPEQAAKPNADQTSAKAPTISISGPALCPRYSCAVLDCSKLLAKSKYFTRQDAFLAKSGMRPISPIVDLTNVLMLETGQPLHAFDYDKFIKVGGAKEAKITVRLALPGEQLQLLDGKTIHCTATDILITSNDVPVALAGAMGGASTEIDSSSRQIILESATFSLYNLRKTQMAHGIFSEAITRFTKGQPASQTMSVLAEATRRLGTNPIAVADCYPAPAEPTVVKITTTEINALLGTDYNTETILRSLENVGFAISAESEPIAITVPPYRTDIHIKEDIIEEVGRLLGFDNIPVNLPLKPFTESKPDPMWQLKSELRTILSDELGLHELLTYSFVSGDLIQKVGEDCAKSYKIVNSLSPELQYFRQSITPSLLDKVRDNLHSGHRDFGLYEINQVADKTEPLDEDAVPRTHFHLGILTFGDYYRIKQIAEYITERLHIELPLEPVSGTTPCYFESAHTAATRLGCFGELRASVLRKFKLGDHLVSALEWDIAPIFAMPRQLARPSSLALSKYPAAERDLTFKTPQSVSYAELDIAIRTALAAESDLLYRLTPASIYQADSASTTRNISFHLEIANQRQTFTTSEISAIIERVIKKVAKLGAEAV